MQTRKDLDYAALTDIALAKRIAQRDAEALRLVTGRNNQRLFRTAWSILKDRAEAAKTVQDGYLEAFDVIGFFAGRSSLSTCLARIIVNKARSRKRHARRQSRLLNLQPGAGPDGQKPMASTKTRAQDKVSVRHPMTWLLEAAIAQLPDALRPVFVLREIEGFSVEEAAEVLQIPGNRVKARLLQAGRYLRKEVGPELGCTVSTTLSFAGADCEAVTERVVARFINQRE